MQKFKYKNQVQAIKINPNYKPDDLRLLLSSLFTLDKT